MPWRAPCRQDRTVEVVLDDRAVPAGLGDATMPNQLSPTNGRSFCPGRRAAWGVTLLLSRTSRLLLDVHWRHVMVLLDLDPLAKVAAAAPHLELETESANGIGTQSHRRACNGLRPAAY
jgi:hypothetical protein